MGMVFVVVQEPSGDLPECGDRIRKRVHANIVSLEGFDEALGDAIRFRALNGSEAREEIESGREGPGLVCGVDAAIVGKPFERVCGAWMAANRLSMASSIMSRTMLPLMPALATACQAMISRSWASMMKARRTRSPFQQEISNPSEHHRRFERMTTTLPSWRRPFLRPVCRARSMPFCRIIRKIRLWLA